MSDHEERGPGRLRIVAGSRRGRRVRVPVGPGVRPTADKVREALFSILGGIEGTAVLDLFAGSGALGLEALSRGASTCAFVERDLTVARVLRRNIADLEFEDRADVRHGDYLDALAAYARDLRRFDLLFVDPPYKMLAEVGAAASRLLPAVLERDGLLVVEGPSNVESGLPLPIRFRRRYGGTLITIYAEE